MNSAKNALGKCKIDSVCVCGGEGAMPRSTSSSRKEAAECSGSHCCYKHTKAGLPVSCSDSVEPPPSPPPSPPPPPSMESSSSPLEPCLPALALPKPACVCSSASSSSSSSTSSPNTSSVSVSQQTVQDTLYEYVKGLQDAIKVPDPDLAERLLVEIGNALSLPSAVSLIISANGARLMASCVKHFRSTTSSSTSKPSKGNVTEAVPVTPAASTSVDAPPPSAGTVSNESRRKRQRTVGDADEEDDAAACQNGEVRLAGDKSRKPVKVKGRSLKVSCSRKVGSSSDLRVEEKEMEGSGVALENGKCWGKECSVKIEDSGIGDLAVKVFEIEEKAAGEVEENSSAGEEDPDSVYSLAKSSGMSNVVATACSALDKLLTAALQSKVGVKYKAGNLTMGVGNGKRGKALSAEMYVALTEAFVDMVHVLKDNVVLLSWCLNCLGSILPPGSLERASFESSTLNNLIPVKEVANLDDFPPKADAVKTDATDSKQQSSAPSDQQLFDQKLFQSKALLKLATKYRDHSTTSDFTLKIGSKSCSGSYVAAARSLSSGKSSKGMLQSTFCGGIASESTSSSISALAAVAYAATVPMLAEKAVKAVLSAMQSCDIESRSTIAALRALSAHLSSTNSKSACDDAFTFIIAAMREFLSDADMQAESCLALGSLIRAVSSTTGHAAWTAITISMERHRDNLVVQRAGCGALQVLCSRTGLGIPEWRTGKRPLRASKDSDREAGARALICSMSSFPNDVRIQWHGCSTLWTLVHSAGVKSVATMVKDGAVSAVVGAMSVCRMNEMMQQEGCNVIGTMVRTLAENGHDIGLFLSPSAKTKSDQEADEKAADDGFGSTDWWAALAAVVSAMKMFSKSKSLQSNGTFALGCILKGSGESSNLGSSIIDTSQPGVPADSEKKISNGSFQVTVMSAQFPGNDLANNVERISAAVEATMAAMREFSKVETVQVWGCAVLQQAFLAYVHYAKCLGPVSEACSSDSGVKFHPEVFGNSLKTGEDASGSNVTSASICLAKFILSQATAAMYMISRTMALSYNPGGALANQSKSNHAVRGKAALCSRSQTATSSLFFSSVRQSWCAALGAIGDVFGYLTRNSEVAIGKGGLVNSDCMDFFRSNKSFFDRSSADQGSHTDLRSCCDDDRSESEDGAQSERSSLDTGKDSHDEASIHSSDGHRCSNAAWIQWTGFGTSQQQAVKDIKAWQEATEAMAKIAEDVGFPLSVKTAILSIRTIFCKLEDAETVIWACHALVSLYLTWENLHLFKPGTEVDREEYKAKIWGDGEAGVRQLVDLVVHWTNQNRLDVTSLALQALYGACVFAATVQEIEKVFALGNPGSEAVLEAMQKALLSGSAQHRRKVVQQACCVLATVCGYSIRAQVAVAVHGGADLILTALDRYNEDNQIQVNGLHALGIDSHAQPAFDAIWNSAISKTGPTGKSSRRRRGNQTSTAVVGLTHIFREGVNCPAFRDTLSPEEATACLQGKWDSCFEKLVLHGNAPIGLFRTALLAAPGCGGPPFAMELLRRLSQSSAELQAHVCFVIGYMAEHNALLRTSFIDARALETILSCMSAIYTWKKTRFTSFAALRDGSEVYIQAQTAGSSINSSGDETLNPVDLRIQCAAAWAIAGLAKSQSLVINATVKSLVQALFVALHRYGGLLSMPSPGVRSKKCQPEVCVPARLALARLGVFSVTSACRTVYLVHEAAETGDMLCLKALAETGVDVLVSDSDGKNGEWHAEQFGQSQVAQYFKEQVQIQGRKKAREKAKAKSKQNNRKKDSSDKQERAQDEKRVTSLSAEVESVVFQPESQCLPDLTFKVVEDDEKPKEPQRLSRNDKKQRPAKDHRTEQDSEVVTEKQGQIDHLNTALREAMASGEVEKMESAIKACELEVDLPDERLLKQVKGALAKRLKRREKAGVLEDQLTAAIDEPSYDRLHAVVLAVEQSSRFVTALQEKLQVAKDLLHEMENVNKVSGVCEEQAIEQEIILEDSSQDWIVSQKNRRRKEKENAVTTTEAVDQDNKSNNSRNKDRAAKPRKQKTKNAPSSMQPPNNYQTGNSHVQIYTERRSTLVAGHDLPPLLPTPRSSFRPVVQPRSVIMPPKTAAQQASSSACEHNPITPQLFPSNRGPLVCNTDFGGESIESPGLAQQQQHPVPSSWSSPRSCSSVDDTRWGTWPASRSSTPVDEHNHGYESTQVGAWPDSPSQDYISTLLATLFPVERLPSSSTTLFSASLGEFPTPRVAECVPPSGLSTVYGPDNSDIMSSSLSNSYVRGSGESNGFGYLRTGGESTGYATGLSNGNLRGDGYSSGNGYASLFLEENPSRMTTSQQQVDPEKHSSTITATGGEQEMVKASLATLSMQSRLQAALIEASLEDSCCICFDMPKDAALVPCGHRMCKPCAEQIRCIRENCPICNRYIDAVLALYG